MSRIILRINMQYVARNGSVYDLVDDVREIDMGTDAFPIVADAVSSFVREVLKHVKEAKVEA